MTTTGAPAHDALEAMLEGARGRYHPRVYALPVGGEPWQKTEAREPSVRFPPGGRRPAAVCAISERGDPQRFACRGAAKARPVHR